jgi:protein gp37
MPIPPHAWVASGADKTPRRRALRPRRQERLRSRLGLRPRVGLLEQRVVLSALPTLTALTASAVTGTSITFTATVSDLSAGGATPTGGTVTFSDQKGTLGSETLADGVATFTPSGLAAGTITVTAAYSGTTAFAPSTTGTIVTAAGNGTAGYKGDNGPATDAELDAPGGMTVDSAGDLFIADQDNNVVREVVKDTGDIITVAGNGTDGYTGDKGPATSAELDDPRDLALDSAGDLFIADLKNNVIREVVKATGDIITIAGNGIAGYSGNNGPATSAELNSPRGVAVDSAGNVFFADNPNNVIREVVKDTSDIIAVAGTGKAGYTGDKGPAIDAELNGPNTVSIDSAGDVFFADANNNAIREVVKDTGVIITVAGNGKAGYTGDNGPATSAEEHGATGVAVDPLGDVFFSDDGNDRIREVVKATGVIITVAGDGKAGYTGDNGPAIDGELGPWRVAVNSAGDVFAADSGNNVIREIAPAVTVTISPTTTTNPPGNGNPITNPPGSGNPITNPIGNPIANPPRTPPPAARPLPVGFLRTPPKIVGVATKMVHRAPEIVLQLDQGIVSTVATKKGWYSVETPGAGGITGTSNNPHVAVSKVVYQAKTRTITLVMPRRLKVQGNVLLTVDASGIVNLLGQELDGDNAVPGAKVVREVDLP